MGPDGASAPSPGQDLTGLGGKKAQDLIENARFEYDGDTIRVYGDLKNLKKPWEEFDSSGNNTGHFIPLTLPQECAEQKVTCRGRTDGDREIEIDPDRILVQRLENLSGLTLEVLMEEETICKFDFTPLVPVGEEAHDAEKTDFGRYGSMALLTEGLTITWKGNKGKATGKLKHYKTGADNLTKEGHYFPLSLSEWYDEVPKEAYIKNKKTVKEKDIILFVEDTKTPITVKYQGKTVMDIDLSGITLEL